MQVDVREMIGRQGCLIVSTRSRKRLLRCAADPFGFIQAAHVDQCRAELVVGECASDLILELDRELPRLAQDRQCSIVLSGAGQDLSLDVGRAGQQRAGTRRARRRDGVVDVFLCRFEQTGAPECHCKLVRRFRFRIRDPQLARERVSEQAITGSLLVEIQATVDAASHQQHAGPGERFTRDALLPRIERFHRGLEIWARVRRARLDERIPQAQGLDLACLRQAGDDTPPVADGRPRGDVIVGGVIGAGKNGKQLGPPEWIQARRQESCVDQGHDPRRVSVDPRIERTQVLARRGIVAGPPGCERNAEQQGECRHGCPLSQHSLRPHGRLQCQAGLAPVKDPVAARSPMYSSARMLGTTVAIVACTVNATHIPAHRVAGAPPHEKGATVACRPYSITREEWSDQNL